MVFFHLLPFITRETWRWQLCQMAPLMFAIQRARLLPPSSFAASMARASRFRTSANRGLSTPQKQLEAWGLSPPSLKHPLALWTIATASPQRGQSARRDSSQAESGLTEAGPAKATASTPGSKAARNCHHCSGSVLQQAVSNSRQWEEKLMMDWKKGQTSRNQNLIWEYIFCVLFLKANYSAFPRTMEISWIGVGLNKRQNFLWWWFGGGGAGKVMLMRKWMLELVMAWRHLTIIMSGMMSIR